MRSSVARRQSSNATRGLKLGGDRKVTEAFFERPRALRARHPELLGTAYVETVPTEVDRDTIIRNMMSGEYDHPLHVIAVNPAKGWARDVSEDIARALVETAVRGGQSLPPGTQGFVESQLGGVLAEAR